MSKSIDKVIQEIEKLEARRAELFEIRKPIDKELVSSAKKLEKLRDKRDQALLEDKQNDWEWLLASEGSTVKYCFVEEKLRSLGLRFSSGYVDTGQYGVEVALTYGSKKSYEKTLAGLKFILPYLKPCDDGKVRIEVFEHTLCQHGSYCLAISKKKIELYRSSWVKESFKTLEDAIRYVQVHHWYEGGESSEEDGE